MATLRLGSKVICPLKIFTPTTITLNVVPKSYAQSFNSNYPSYGKIVVSPVTADIDSNIIPENIKNGVEILGVEGTYVSPTPPQYRISYNIDSNDTLVHSSTFINTTGIYNIDQYALCGAWYGNTLLSGDISFPDLVSGGIYAFDDAFYGCTNISSISFPNLESIEDHAGYAMCYGAASITSINLGKVKTIQNSGLYNAFKDCTELTSVNLSSLTTVKNDGLNRTFNGCSALSSIDLSTVETVQGTSAFYGTFFGCSSLTNMDFISLENILEPSTTFTMCFYMAYSLKRVTFPSLLLSNLNINSNIFSSMLSLVTGCTVHFPVILEPIMENWSDVQNGFGGTNTNVLFDLPAFGRDIFNDLVFDSATGAYIPAE